MTKTPIIGMIQNMAQFKCPRCDESVYIFGGKSSVKSACKDHDIEFLGDIPLHPNICEDADRGKPTVVAEPASDIAKAFLDIADRVGYKIGLS